MQRTEMQSVASAMGAQGVVAAGPRAPHGGITPAELELAGRAREQVLDLSVCVNPFGPPGEVFRAVREATLTDYPDPECRLARRRIADQQGVRPDQIALGHGASELLWTLARTLIRPGTRVLLVEPAFGEFGAAAYASGAQIDVLRCIEQRNFDLSWAELGERIGRWAPQVVSLAGPTSPAGRHLSLVGLADIALSFPATWFILDQSYLALSEFCDDLDIALPPNVVAVRSLTKELGIPAVRVGYCLAPELLVRQLEMQRPAWTVSTATQCAATAAMRSHDQIKEHRQRLLFLRQQLSRGLNELGLTTLESCTHFFLARLPQPAPVRDVGELRYQLLTRHGVLVRDCSGFGLVGWFRVSAHPEQDTLLTALRNMGFRAERNTAGQAIGSRNPSTAPSVGTYSPEHGNRGVQRGPFVPPQLPVQGVVEQGFDGSLSRGDTTSVPPHLSQPAAAGANTALTFGEAGAAAAAPPFRPAGTPPHRSPPAFDASARTTERLGATGAGSLFIPPAQQATAGANDAANSGEPQHVFAAGQAPVGVGGAAPIASSVEGAAATHGVPTQVGDPSGADWAASLETKAEALASADSNAIVAGSPGLPSLAFENATSGASMGLPGESAPAGEGLTPTGAEDLLGAQGHGPGPQHATPTDAHSGTLASVSVGFAKNDPQADGASVMVAENSAVAKESPPSGGAELVPATVDPKPLHEG